MKKGYKNKDDIERHLKIQMQAGDALKNIAALSSKKPNEPLNGFKLNFINKLIVECNEFLPSEYLPDENFTSFSDEELPTYSDVLLMLSQYVESLKKLRSDSSVHHYAHGLCWVVNGEMIIPEDDEEED